MDLVLYVHDFKLEVGHSNAMIELCRNLDLNKISTIEVVSYTCAKPQDLLPEHHQKIKICKVPFSWLKPSLLRNMFFHLWAFITFFHKKSQTPKSIHISVGAASLVSDIVNIQFVHAQWNPIFFKVMNMPFLKWVYKKISFSYFAWSEKFFFLNPKTKFLALSNFVKDYCQKEFHIPDSHIQTIYSGVNLTRFSPQQKNKFEIIESLKPDYPQLGLLDATKPVILFIGAFERKGLPSLVRVLEQVPDSQLLVIGKPETSSHFSFPANLKICHISFTQAVEKFYDIGDAFIFPCLYDPFGLVVLEAFAKGLPVVTYKNNIGASELIENQEEVYFLENLELQKFIENLKISTMDDRILLHEKRSPHLAHLNWESAGADFQIMLDSYLAS